MVQRHIEAHHYWIVWKETYKIESDPRNLDHTRTGCTPLAWQKYTRDKPLIPKGYLSYTLRYMVNWKGPMPSFLLHPIDQARIYNMVSTGAYTVGKKTKFLGTTLESE